MPVAEEEDGLVVRRRELEGDVGADPFGRTVDAAPVDLLRGGGRLDLHDHLADDVPLGGTEGEFNVSAGLGASLHIPGPPIRQALEGGQRGEDAGNGGFDADAMDDVD